MRWTSPTERAEWDVIVIGSGAAGLTAALAAVSRGRTVAVLEKAGLFGGTSAISAGTIWVPGLGDTDVEAARMYLRAQGAAHVDTIVDSGAEMIGFLTERTRLRVTRVEGFPDYLQHLPGASFGNAAHPDLYDGSGLGRLRPLLRTDGNLPFTQGELKDLGYGWANLPRTELELRRERGVLARGAALVGPILEACAAAGVSLAVDAPVSDVRRDGDGWLVISGDRSLRAFDSVILASGGFEWDTELRQRYFGDGMEATCSPPGFNTGDALRIAERLGAATDALGEAWWAPLVPANNEVTPLRPGILIRIERMGPGTITVGVNGRRFANESQDYNAFIRKARDAELAAPGSVFPMHLIFDQQFLDRYGYDGSQSVEGKPGVVSALTVRELAEISGIDPDNLVATVDEFNERAHASMPDSFGRGESKYDQYYGDSSWGNANPCIAPIERGPYYSVLLFAGAFGTCGGVVTDADARVLDVSDGVVEGLFAVGNVAAHPLGRSYAGAGATLGPGMTMAYRAGLLA